MRNLPIQTSNRRGFTIIEVVLVLAIAGLIFLMVFIALPNMQASQRNTQRRNDYNSFATQVTNYATNHNGSLPPEGASVTTYKQWFNANGKDPDDNDYKVTIQTCAAATCANAAVGDVSRDGATKPQAILIYKSKCDGGTAKQAEGKKQFTIVGYIEDGNGVAGTYCLESHA